MAEEQIPVNEEVNEQIAENEPYFSLIVWTHNPNMDQFKNMLESIDEQEYREFELYIIDETGGGAIEKTIHEFFPDMVDKVHYRLLKNKKGGAYAYNIGSRFAEGDHYVYVGQHDRLSRNTLLELRNKIVQLSEAEDTMIYSDHDELVGQDRMHPHFKGGFNKELFLRTNYIGSFICISAKLYRAIGTFNEKATESYIYEYILRCAFKGKPIWHIPALLYHERQKKKPITKEEKKAAAYVQKEHMALVQSYLSSENVVATLRPDPSYIKWEVEYDSSEFRRFGGDYMYLHEDDVRLYSKKNVQYMYGFLKQPDVAVVGVRFIDRGFTIDNIGYIFDSEGIAYPAFHGQKVYQDSLEGLAKIPRDVSMVDAGCCLIDAKVYRMLRGFDPKLSGRDAMLDFCIRAKKKGYRTVVVPRCTARYKTKQNVSSESSHNALLEKHGDYILAGDNYYNRNLPIGLQNYILPGMEEE